MDLFGCRCGKVGNSDQYEDYHEVHERTTKIAHSEYRRAKTTMEWMDGYDRLILRYQKKVVNVSPFRLQSFHEYIASIYIHLSLPLIVQTSSSSQV
jgi:hypothetical protein